MKKIVFALLTIIILSPVAAYAADDTPKARAMLVLDASGSMWGQVDGKNKIVIAREVLADMMKDWDKNVHLGLSAYGHNSKGDCNDIETLVKTGADTGGKIVKIVNDLNPKGMTPLSAAVKKAAEELKYTEQAATVILLSDGIETCDLDPCEVGKALEESGVDFTAHVIGFDVKTEDQKGLKCLAENTGGMFLSANNAGQLGEALETIAQQVRKGGDAVYVIVGDNGERYGQKEEDKHDVKFEVFAVDENDEPSGDALSSWMGQFVEIKEPGRYYVKARVGPSVYGGQVVEVKEDQTQEHEIDIRAGTFNLSALMKEGEPVTGKNVYWRVYPYLEDGSVSGDYIPHNGGIDHSVVIKIPAGKYQMEIKYYGASKRIDIDSEAGKTVDMEVSLDAGTVELTPALGDGLKEADIYWRAYPLDENGNTGDQRDVRIEKKTVTLYLNEGKYRIEGTHQPSKIKTPIDVDVKAGGTIQETVSFEKPE